MYKYRIYTEDKDREYIRYRVGEDFEGYTVYYGTGIWNEAEEASVTIEIITPKDIHDIKSIAEDIKRHNSQQAILVTQEIVIQHLY